ncbi:DUF2878 domain-containing protein [Woeseia oceani]|uniref:DUF2878 domain-containing protein n=1 Tax=Woeseia oceani TaxID=1548547 RepID=A0A193LFG9_9GAMM|nr:DUF2878 domain-containing protein [Woeseia oceani]ANO51208.1 hypothetical protein BA177_08335 [Woeseia oceani]
MSLLVNFLAFQVAWFSAVISAAAGQPWIGMSVMAVAVMLHMTLVARPATELGLVVVCAVIGGTWDSVLVALGWVSYPSGMLHDAFAPYWIVGMWMLFATTLNVSLGWLKSRASLAVLFGVAGGPLAYLTGAKLGGIVLSQPLFALMALAAGWGIMMPLLLIVARRLDGVTVRSAARTGWILD